MSKKLNSGSPEKRSVSDLAPVCYGESQQGERDALRQASGAGLWHGRPDVRLHYTTIRGRTAQKIYKFVRIYKRITGNVTK